MARLSTVLLLALALLILPTLVACGGSVSQSFSQINSGLSAGSTAAPPPTAAAAAALPAAAVVEPNAQPAPGADAARESEAAPAPVSEPVTAGGAPADASGAMPAATAAATAPAADSAPQRPLGPEASLKAGEIDDNAAFADYQAYLNTYQWNDVRKADISERYVIKVLDNNQRPVLDARVTIYDSERAVFRGRTYAGGETIFMPLLLDDFTKEYRVVAEYGQSRTETTLRRHESEQVELGLRDITIDETLRLDLLFLLDTTGSMGDELTRIQETIDSIAQRIDGFTPRPVIRYGLVAYRDEGDSYVTRPFDFTPDLATFRAKLEAQSADGGGDTPEALDQALYDAVVRASWHNEPAVRLVFLVADAGPHVPGTAQFTYLDGAREAVARGVKIYPIAASNTDPQAEYVFRQLAQQTMAGFVFLTYQEGESSGAPGESTTLEAGEQPYTVERLDDLIVSIVERELAAAIGAR